VLQRHLKTHRAVCPTDATVDLAPPPLQTFQPLLRRNREALLAPKALKRAPTARASMGVWGHAPPGNFANLVSPKWHFLHFDIIFVVFFKVLDSEKMH